MKQEFKLKSSGYLQNAGVDVMAFDDIYPEGHQSGVSIIMHGNRIATNGDYGSSRRLDSGSLCRNRASVNWTSRRIRLRLR